MTANYEYSRSNRENLPLPIQMQLSVKTKNISLIFIAFLESTLNFEHFEKKWASLLKYFWSSWLRKTCLPKYIKGLVSENPLAVNVLRTEKILCVFRWDFWRLHVPLWRNVHLVIFFFRNHDPNCVAMKWNEMSLSSFSVQLFSYNWYTMLLKRMFGDWNIHKIFEPWTWQ